MPDEFVVGDSAYRWHEVGLRGADARGWAHHDVTPLRDGALATAHPDGHRLVLIDARGRQRTVETGLTEFHGIAVSDPGGAERLWISDIGHEFVPAAPRYVTRRTPGRVVELDLAGTIYRELMQPDIARYESAGWSPCATVTGESRPGAGRDIWVADGYGQSLVHRYDPAGAYVGTLDGETSGRAFATPHALLIDRRRNPAELYVADRGNARIVVFDLDGRFLREVGTGVLTSPSGLAVSGGLLFVTELFGSVAVLDSDDELVARLGGNSSHDRAGWPNALESGVVTAPPLLPGCFNSPHGIGADESGSVYVSEWMIGGRLIKLTPS